MSRPPQHPGLSHPQSTFTAPLPLARRAPMQPIPSSSPHSSPASSPSAALTSAAGPSFLAYPPSLSPPLPFFAAPPLPRSPQSYTAAANQLTPTAMSASPFALQPSQQQLLYLAHSMQQQQAALNSHSSMSMPASLQSLSTIASLSSDGYHSAGGSASLLSAQPAFVTQSLSHAGLPLSLSSPSAAAALSLMSGQLPAQPFNVRSQSSPTVGAPAMSVPIYLTPPQLQPQQQQQQFSHPMQHSQSQQQSHQPHHQQQQQQHPSVLNVLYSSSTPSATATSVATTAANLHSNASLPANPAGLPGTAVNPTHFLQPSPSTRLTSLGSYGSLQSLQSELSVVSPAPSSESLLSAPNTGMEVGTSPSASDRAVSQMAFQRGSPSTSPPQELTRLLQHALSASGSQLSSSSTSHVLLPGQTASPAVAGTMAGAMASQLFPVGALSAAYVDSSQRLLMEHDYIGAYLHALLSSHQAGLPAIVHERAELLKRLALDKLRQASMAHATLIAPHSAYLAGGIAPSPLISPQLQAVLTQYALTLPHTNAGFFSELAAISSPAAVGGAVPSILLPQQPLGVRSFSAPSPILSPTAHAAVFFTPSALSTATASPSSSPSSSTSSSPSLLERTTGRSASTSCKYCGRTWLLSSLSSPTSREKRNKQLKAKRDHQPFCVANPARVNNLDKRRKKKKRREERERRNKVRAEGGGAAGAGEAGGDGGVGGEGEGEDDDDDDDDDSEAGSEMEDDINEAAEDAEQSEAAGAKRIRRGSGSAEVNSSMASKPAVTPTP